MPAERDTSDGAGGGEGEEPEAPERDRSADDVCTKFVVCIVNYSCLVILITIGISFAVGIWTLSEVYEQGVEGNDIPTPVQLPEWQWNAAMREVHQRAWGRPVCRLR